MRWLASSLEITLRARVVSYYDAVETRRAAELIQTLQAGQDVLLVTDAGTPGISDPGYRLVAAAAAAGIRVTALPGPSAVTTALAVSGLPTDRFCFEGFPPRRAGERQRRFAELATDRRTQVYFESPRRLAQTLTELAASHGEDRQAVVCRELTKIHEEIVRGPLAELSGWAGSGAVRGEITLVVAGTGRRGIRGNRAESAPESSAAPETVREPKPDPEPEPAAAPETVREAPTVRRTAFTSSRSPARPAVPGLNAMTAARQANGTAGSTYR